jgi:hypothetical protein
VGKLKRGNGVRMKKGGRLGGDEKRREGRVRRRGAKDFAKMGHGRRRVVTGEGKGARWEGEGREGQEGERGEVEEGSGGDKEGEGEREGIRGAGYREGMWGG